jgi:hypothetical protein
MGIVDGSIHWNGQDNFVDFIQFAAAKVGMTREEYISHYGRGIDEADKKPGPDPYHRGLEDDEVEDKEDQIKKQAEMDDDDPDAYKEMPGDKEAREKGEVKTSKATKAYNKIYGEDLDEGTMSDIHQMAGEAKSKEDFLKKFFKEYGAKIKKTKDSEEWAASMYDEMDESKVEETQKMTKKEWRHIKKFNKHVTDSGEKFVMNYDDRIGTFLEPVEIVDETVTPENPVHEADDTEQKSTDRGPLDDDKIETALKKKAEDTGVPIGIIRAVMRRGLAAWKSGHRPGANQQQWGYARVNAFLTKGEGTWGKADKDLAKEVRDGGHDKKLKKA